MTQNWRSWCWKFVKGGAFFLGGAFAFGENHALAQTMIPDATLGAERSVVTSGVDVGGVPAERIDGGATRGINLFHSFFEFNVGEGQRVYFANPAGIENILTRVTGTNASHVLGTLGVSDGSANLFLINPNGIIFGSNARLDIGGSFFASTASSFKFPDGSDFSATNPMAPPLLTVNVTPGLQWGASSPGVTIINRGNLASQQDLMLFADKLDLQGQLEAGGDLTLWAQDTVKVRDSLMTPFLAIASGNLTVEGNGGIDILALNHPTQMPFVSGGNLSLISDGIISGDARFRSGGSFSIKSVSGGVANFISYYDPIISSTGDVDVAANYTGTSLLVEAQGNIRFWGDINITGPDTSTLPDGPDTATLSSSSALIMRSGQSILAYGGVDSGTVPAYGNEPVPAGITIGGDVIVQPFNEVGGTVSLLAASGNVNTRLISTNGQQTHNFDNEAYGGAIRLEAANGSINTDDLFSYSYSGNAGNGGTINLEAANGSITTGYLYSYSSSFSDNAGNAGNGGAISLETSNGSITVSDLVSFSVSIDGNAGNGGAISLEASNGSITTGPFLSSPSSSGSGHAGNGGAISLEAFNGSITTGPFLTSYSSSGSGRAGNGGAISLEAFNGSITTGYLTSSSSSGSGRAGNGGVISLEAVNGSIATGSLFSYSSSGSDRAGNGGNISLEATNTIQFQSLTFPGANLDLATLVPGGASINSTGVLGSGNISIVSNAPLALDNTIITSDTFGSGRGGDIYISTPSISLRGGAQISASTHSNGSGGNINLIASDSVELSGVTPQVPQGIFNQAGFATIPPGTFLGGFIPTGEVPPTVNGIPQFPPGTLFLSGVFTQTTVGSTGSAGNISIETGQLIIKEGAAIATSTFGQNSNAGNISVQAVDSISVDNGSIKSGVAGGARGNSGNITVNTNTLSAVNGGQLLTSSSGDGQAGDIIVNAQQIQLSGSNSGLFAQTSSAANAGNLTLQPLGEGQTLTVNFFEGAQISASTSSRGRGGNLTITAPESITLSGNGSIISAETSGSGTGGDLTLQTGTLTVREGAKVTVSGSQTGNAGNLEITANSVLLDNGGNLIAETASGEGGNIKVQVQDLLLMRRNSLISTSAGTASAGGNGGNITISAPFVVAVPVENSDIRANAYTGTGGQVDLTANVLIGLQFRQTETPYSDITASSQYGVQGTVILNTPNVDPSRGLTNLPNEVVDASNQIAQNCRPGRAAASEQSSFVVTGRGGLPPNPKEALSSDDVFVNLVPLPLGEENRSSPVVSENPASTTPAPPVEAQGWVMNDLGQVVLTASAPTVTPHSSWLPPNSCGAPQSEVRTGA